MPRRFLVLLAATGLILGCRDDPAGLQPGVNETARTTVDLTQVRDRLDHPLVLELVGDLSDRVTPRRFHELISALATPPAQDPLDEIHWTFGEVLSGLTTESGNDEDEVERAILELIVREAEVALDGLVDEKGS